MKQLLNSKLTKIIIVFCFAFLFSQLLTANVFTRKGPAIQRNLVTYLSKKIQKIWNDKDFIAFFTYSQSENEKKVVETIVYLKDHLQPITKGIRAASSGSVSYREYKLGEVDWVEANFVLPDGKTITVRYPKGTEPPPMELFE